MASVSQDYDKYVSSLLLTKKKKDVVVVIGIVALIL